MFTSPIDDINMPNLSKIQTLKQLAKFTAQTVKLSQNRLKNIMDREDRDAPFHQIYYYFKNDLIIDLNRVLFINIFPESIACALVAAKIIQKQEFSIQTISQLFPTNPLLENIFHITFPVTETSFSKSFCDELGIKGLIELLQTIRIDKIVRASRHVRNRVDPITQFYELFLHFTDSKKTYQKGIFHTPSPIAEFIVNSLDYLLKTEFNAPNGLLDQKAQILDPAVGTGIFLEILLKKIKTSFDHDRKELTQDTLRSQWESYVSNSLFSKVMGFELLLTPYILAHLKLGFLLKQTGLEFSTKQRLNLILTNTLNVPLSSEPTQSLSNEEKVANAIKKSNQISVILGNPPYARSSQNTSPYIERLMDSYKRAVRIEKNLQPLSDDYIKFFRIAHDFIERTGHGIIGFITNHTFLTGIIHRGMREELMKTFDCIYIVDLHGSKIIHEKVPNTIKDENVFDIKQGVCITFLIKNPFRKNKKIYLYNLYGNQKFKLNWLNDNEISTIPWIDLPNLPLGAPFTPPTMVNHVETYPNFVSLTEIFDFYNVGGKPGDDSLLVSFIPEKLTTKLKDFLKKIKNKDRLGRLTEAKTKLIRTIDNFELDKSKIERYNYRPFDYRWTYYDPAIWTRPVRKLKIQCVENPLLLCSRIVKDDQFAHVLTSNHFTDVIFLSNTSSVNCYVFPLHKKNQTGTPIWNLSPHYLAYLEKMDINIRDMKNLDPLAYIYALLFSNKYRSHYGSYLKRDFPRIPFIYDKKLFSQLVKWGKELLQIHLFPQEVEINPGIETNIKDSLIIPRGYPKFKDNCVFITLDRFVCGLRREEWDFKIGKYQVCYKWLKDRGLREFSPADLLWYCRIISIIKETLRLMHAIDTTIDIDIFESTIMNGV